jgi:hypothetical protein
LARPSGDRFLALSSRTRRCEERQYKVGEGSFTEPTKERPVFAHSGRLKSGGSAVRAGEHFSVADVTSLVTVDFATRAFDMPISTEMHGLRRWYAVVAARLVQLHRRLG